MAEVTQKIFWITIVCLEFSFSFSEEATWKQSMRICGILGKRPLTEKDVLQNDTWVGKAKFVLKGGTLTLEIQEVEQNQTSLDCNSREKQYEFCKRPIRLNNFSSFEEIIQDFTPGHKYVIGDFDKISIKEIPPPTNCMVHRGLSHMEYVPCNNSFVNSCTELEKSSQIKIIISLNPSSGIGSTNSSCTQRSLEGIKRIGNAFDCSWQSLLQGYKYQLLALGGVLATLLIISNMMCINWCVRYQVKKQIRSKRKGKIQEISRIPLPEAITRIYRNMKFEENSSYDLVSNMSGTNANNKEINSAHYDKGFFRLLTQSSDYDVALSNSWSTPSTPDVDYDVVQKVGNPAMGTVPEEEIYSKHRSDPKDMLKDINMSSKSHTEDTGPDYLTGTPSYVPVETRPIGKRIGGNEAICDVTYKRLLQNRETTQTNINGNSKAAMNPMQNQEGPQNKKTESEAKKALVRKCITRDI